jgi:hypothetical protein
MACILRHVPLGAHVCAMFLSIGVAPPAMSLSWYITSLGLLKDLLMRRSCTSCMHIKGKTCLGLVACVARFDLLDGDSVSRSAGCALRVLNPSEGQCHSHPCLQWDLSGKLTQLCSTLATAIYTIRMLLSVLTPGERSNICKFVSGGYSTPGMPAVVIVSQYIVRYCTVKL